MPSAYKAPLLLSSVAGAWRGMAGGCVQLRRINNRAARQLTFSKRLAGLRKKSHELAVLCDAEVGLIVFSDTSELHHFSSNRSMEEIIEHYQRFTQAERDVNVNGHQEQGHAEGSTSSRTNSQPNSQPLDIAQRPLDESNLVELDMNELEQIEEELNEVLRKSRSRKKQLMMDMIAKLHEQGNTLPEGRSRLGSVYSGDAPSIVGEKEGRRHDVNNESNEQAGNPSLGMCFTFWPTRNDVQEHVSLGEGP